MDQPHTIRPEPRRSESAASSRRLLALVEAPGHVCYRYRIAPFRDALAAHGWALDVEPLPRTSVARLRLFRSLGSYDVVLLQRRTLPAWQAALLRRCTRRLVFDMDDAVMFRDSYHPRGIRSPSRWRRFRSTVRRCDAVLAGNAFLADQARAAGVPDTKIHDMPTCVDCRDYLVREPSVPAPDRARLELAWVGSSSTAQGLIRRVPLWDRIAAELPGVRLRMICDRPVALGAMPVEFVPWSRETEAAELAACDVGVSVLPDDPWSRGKCGLKVLQFMAAGLPVVADPVGVHPEMVREGITGFLPGSEDAWVAALSTLARDAESRRTLGHAGRLEVESRYDVRRWVGPFLEHVCGHQDPGDPGGQRRVGYPVVRAGARPTRVPIGAGGTR